jgi:hypothetical protein
MIPTKPLATIVLMALVCFANAT